MKDITILFHIFGISIGPRVKPVSSELQPSDIYWGWATFPTVTFSTIATLSGLLKMEEMNEEQRGLGSESY
jgi:hypothetical protein